MKFFEIFLHDSISILYTFSQVIVIDVTIRKIFDESLKFISVFNQTFSDITN